MKKIAVFSDIHGNYEALKAILNNIKAKNYDEVIFLGDAIGIGPNPYDCLNLLLNSDITFIYGNHEMYALNGCNNFKNIQKQSRPHHLWTENEINTLKNKLNKKMVYSKVVDNVIFFHYAKDNKGFIKRPNDFPTIEYLNNIYKNVKEKYIIFGHSHNTNYNKDEKVYYCLGSSGCVKDNHTFYTEIIIDSKVTFNKIIIEYNRDEFVKYFEKTNYPLKEFMGKVFFGIGDDNITNLIAHRGMHDKNIPENSILSFKKAIDYNIPIELDIQITKDNKIIVYHDKNLLRLTGLNKNVYDCTYKELEELRLNNTQEKIPLLTNVLELVNGHVLLDIELKSYKNNNLVYEFIKIIKNYNGDILVKSFNYKIVKYLLKHTNYKTGMLIPDLDKYKFSKIEKFIIRNINFNHILKPDFIACEKTILNYKCIKNFKKDIYIWTIINKDEIKKYKANFYICENVF